jgi:peroxiredoxin
MVPRLLLVAACLLAAVLPAPAAPDTPFLTPERSPALPFTLPDLSGRIVRSADFAGKVAVLSFGATWCTTCTAELRSLERLQARFPADLAVYFVALDGRGEKDVKPFMDTHGHHLATLIDPRMAVAREHGVRWIPVTLVVDRQGLVVGRAVGPRDWDGKEALEYVQAVLQR